MVICKKRTASVDFGTSTDSRFSGATELQSSALDSDMKRREVVVVMGQIETGIPPQGGSISNGNQHHNVTEAYLVYLELPSPHKQSFQILSSVIDKDAIEGFVC